jgi:hypothetical protein
VSIHQGVSFEFRLSSVVKLGLELSFEMQLESMEEFVQTSQMEP